MDTHEARVVYAKFPDDISDRKVLLMYPIMSSYWKISFQLMSKQPKVNKSILVKIDISSFSIYWIFYHCVTLRVEICRRMFLLFKFQYHFCNCRLVFGLFMIFQSLRKQCNLPNSRIRFPGFHWFNRISNCGCYLFFCRIAKSQMDKILLNSWKMSYLIKK